LPSDFFHALEKEGFSTTKEAHEAALTVEDYAELGVTDPVQVGNLRALISDEYDREEETVCTQQTRNFRVAVGRRTIATCCLCPPFHLVYSSAILNFKLVEFVPAWRCDS